MRRYVTISVTREVKKKLERLKKAGEDWNSFLSRLVDEYEEMKKRLAFEKLVEILTPEDLDNVERSVKKFRDSFRLGES